MHIEIWDGYGTEAAKPYCSVIATYRPLYLCWPWAALQLRTAARSNSAHVTGLPLSGLGPLNLEVPALGQTRGGGDGGGGPPRDGTGERRWTLPGSAGQPLPRRWYSPRRGGVADRGRGRLRRAGGLKAVRRPGVRGCGLLRRHRDWAGGSPGRRRGHGPARGGDGPGPGPGPG